MKFEALKQLFNKLIGFYTSKKGIDVFFCRSESNLIFGKKVNEYHVTHLVVVLHQRQMFSDSPAPSELKSTDQITDFKKEKKFRIKNFTSREMNNIISFLWLSLLRFLWLVHWYISNKQDMKKNWFLILNSCYRYCYIWISE